MKIAYLFSRYPAVSHTFCDTEMLAHARAGLDFEIDVIRPPLTSFRHGHAAQLQTPIHYVPAPPILRTFEQRARREGRYPDALIAEHEKKFGTQFKPVQRARNAFYLAETFKQRGVSLVHVHFANRATQTAMFIKALSGIPFSFTAHGQDFMSDLGSPELLDAMCREAAFIVAVSNYSRDLLVKSCPAAAGKIHRIHNGINLVNFPAAPATHRSTPRILSVGRLQPVKGHQHLITACGLLRDRGVPFDCEIAGDGPARDSLQQTITDLRLNRQVRLTGWQPQEQVFRQLAASDIFALPSVVNNEGATDILPTVVLEAMAAARPVVASAVGGLTELVDHDKTGLLVPAENPQALAEALGRLLLNPTLREELGNAGRRKVETEFRVEKSAETLRGLFQRHGRPSVATDPVKTTAPTFAYFIAQWPPADSGLRRELLAVKAAYPEMHIIIARVAPTYSPDPGDEAIFDIADFLPDGMVLEAEWQQERTLARDVELWRNQLAIDADEYLTQARWALHLRKFIGAANIRHLHVAGSAGLPGSWILQKLCGVSRSATIEDSSPRSVGQLQQLTTDCKIIRTLHRDLLKDDRRFVPDFPPPRASLFARLEDNGAALQEWIKRLTRLVTQANPA